MKKQRVSFKTTRPTGRYSSFDNPYHEIKVNGLVCGVIVHGEWKIRLQIIKDENNTDNNPNCAWKWIQLNVKSNSLDEAKQYVIHNINGIMAKWQLFFNQ